MAGSTYPAMHFVLTCDTLTQSLCHGRDSQRLFGKVCWNTKFDTR